MRQSFQFSFSRDKCQQSSPYTVPALFHGSWLDSIRPEYKEAHKNISSVQPFSLNKSHGLVLGVCTVDRASHPKGIEQGSHCNLPCPSRLSQRVNWSPFIDGGKDVIKGQKGTAVPRASISFMQWPMLTHAWCLSKRLTSGCGIFWNMELTPRKYLLSCSARLSNGASL